jgi:transketolase
VRAAFARAITELAERDPRVLLLTGDLGFMALEPFSERFPERFFNVGVAEQNMVGLATGLAEAGFVPFVYSIVTFATLRPYEFIRNGPVHHRLPVRIVGIGGGFEYGPAGPTHHGLEDVAVMRGLPGMVIVAPADPGQTRTAIERTWELPGPVYYRLGKDDRVVVPGLDGRFELGRVQVLREGRDLLILAMGGIAEQAVAAADRLAADGVSATIGVVASVQPPPVADLRALLSAHRLTVTVEAHYVTGGLGSLVAEVAAEAALPTRLVRCGVEAPSVETGSQRYLERRNGLSADALAERVRRELGR